MNRIERATDVILRWFPVFCYSMVCLCLPVVLLFAADARPLPQNAPTLAPERPTKADEVVADRIGYFVVWDTEIVDGDTFDGQAEMKFGNGWKVCTDGRKRFRGDWDSWESTCVRFGTANTSDEELARGRMAENAFDSMMGKAKRKFVQFRGDGSFSRDKVRLFWVMEDGSVIDAKEWMISNNHDRTTKPDGSKR